MVHYGEQNWLLASNVIMRLMSQNQLIHHLLSDHITTFLLVTYTDFGKQTFIELSHMTPEGNVIYWSFITCHTP